MVFLLPTDTCYGLAGAFSEQDYLELYHLKGRDFVKPLAWLIRDYRDISTYIEISNDQIEYLRHYPRPWSILGKRKNTFDLPGYLDTEVYQKISLRIAEDCIVADIRDRLNYPLFLTSANISGMLESKTLDEAKVIFPDIEGYDGGICDLPPSDILSFGEDGAVVYSRRHIS